MVNVWYAIESLPSLLQIKSAIPHPLIMGVIHECGGRACLGGNGPTWEWT